MRTLLLLLMLGFAGWFQDTKKEEPPPVKPEVVIALQDNQSKQAELTIQAQQLERQYMQIQSQLTAAMNEGNQILTNAPKECGVDAEKWQLNPKTHKFEPKVKPPAPPPKPEPKK